MFSANVAVRQVWTIKHNQKNAIKCFIGKDTQIGSSTKVANFNGIFILANTRKQNHRLKPTKFHSPGVDFLLQTNLFTR